MGLVTNVYVFELLSKLIFNGRGIMAVPGMDVDVDVPLLPFSFALPDSVLSRRLGLDGLDAKLLGRMRQPVRLHGVALLTAS